MSNHDSTCFSTYVAYVSYIWGFRARQDLWSLAPVMSDDWWWWPNDIRGPWRPKASRHLSYRCGKNPKNPHQGYLTRPGIEPGTLRDRRALFYDSRRIFSVYSPRPQSFYRYSCQYSERNCPTGQNNKLDLFFMDEMSPQDHISLDQVYLTYCSCGS